MSRKRERIRNLMEQWRENHMELRHMEAFVAYFNRQMFYEAHEILEDLWLPNRNGFDGAFYKGLIQLAGAFVHVQKKRAGPAAALLSLAQSNLKNYPSAHHGLNVVEAKRLIEECALDLKQVGVHRIDGWQCHWPTLRLLN